MAFATITFLTTIFYSVQAFHLQIRNSNDTKKNSGFHRFYGYFLNGEVLSIHRSLFFHLTKWYCELV